jgi:hypothetical protein
MVLYILIFKQKFNTKAANIPGIYSTLCFWMKFLLLLLFPNSWNLPHF